MWREFVVAIPKEFDKNGSVAVISAFAKTLTDAGMCVDAAIHWDDGNHHAHIMATTRPFTANGEWGQKRKIETVYRRDGDGNKIPVLDAAGNHLKEGGHYIYERIPEIDKKTGEQKRNKRGKLVWKREEVDVCDWNQKYKVDEWRREWENICNENLKEVGSEERIDRRSYAERGIDKIATVHVGCGADAEAKRELNDMIQERNDITEIINGLRLAREEEEKRETERRRQFESELAETILSGGASRPTIDELKQFQKEAEKFIIENLLEKEEKPTVEKTRNSDYER
jgi:RNase H-fold protein (predicted Holliday junction resolvase)